MALHVVCIASHNFCRRILHGFSCEAYLQFNVLIIYSLFATISGVMPSNLQVWPRKRLLPRQVRSFRNMAKRKPTSPNDPLRVCVVETEPASYTGDSLYNYYRGTRFCKYYGCCSAKYRDRNINVSPRWFTGHTGLIIEKRRIPGPSFSRLQQFLATCM